MFNEKLQPYYQGRVLMNESALNDPVLIAVLDEMNELIKEIKEPIES